MREKAGIWVTAYADFARAVSDHCSRLGDWYRSNGGRGGANIDKALKNGNTHGRIERMLMKAPELIVSLTNFDADPWQLNSKEGIGLLSRRMQIPHFEDGDQ